MAIELDGEVHNFKIEKDKRRDEILNDMGLRVLRIKNGELDNIEEVLGRIMACFNI